MATPPELKHPLAVQQALTQLRVILQQANADSQGDMHDRDLDTASDGGLDAKYGAYHQAGLVRVLGELLQLLKPRPDNNILSCDDAALEEEIRAKKVKSIGGVLHYNGLLAALQELLEACSAFDLEWRPTKLAKVVLEVVDCIASWRCLQFFLLYAEKGGLSICQLLKRLKKRYYSRLDMVLYAGMEPDAKARKTSREHGPRAVAEGGRQLPTIAPVAHLLLNLEEKTTKAEWRLSMYSDPVLVGSPTSPMPEMAELRQHLSSAGSVTILEDIQDEQGARSNGWWCRVRYQNKFNAEAAASILDGNKLGKHPLVVVPYENLTTGLVEVGPGASEDSIEGALAGSLWWKPVVDSDGTRSAYILASFSSAPVGDEMREIARMLGTEQKAVLEFRDGRFGPCTVSISGIDYKVKARQLRAAFQAAGTVVKVELKKNGRGKSSGKAWVTFLEPDGATTAVEGLDNAVVGRRDRPVRVRRTAHSGQST